MPGLSLFHDTPVSEPLADQFAEGEVLAKLQLLDKRAARKGLEGLDPTRNQLIPLGTEIDAQGRVTKNSYGVFHLAWRAEAAGNWPQRVVAELDEIKAAIRKTHGARLRFLIWAGMGGSAEDKSMYNAVGLLKRGPRVYVLDSTDPAKLKSILADIEKRSTGTLGEALKSTLVVGMAMGMTSYEPVVNLRMLATLYEKHNIDSRPNFIYMTLPGSLLDQFASERGYRCIELQMDDGNATAGRHSGPLTRGSLYPLGLAQVDLDAWIRATFLTSEQIHTAWRLAAFLEAQARAGRDKITLLLNDSWAGAALWTKQDFEESLGKSEEIGLKIVIGEKPKLANYLPAKDPAQDRVFLAIQTRGAKGPDAEKVSLLRRKGYPVAVVKFPAVPLSAYMQFIHYVVFGLAYLRNMNFVTQPSVELYKAITNRLFETSGGDIRASEAWKQFQSRAVRYRGGITLYCSFVGNPPEGHTAPEIYAQLARRGRYAELTFFGDLRYSPKGQRLRKSLDRAAESLFRARLKRPVDVYEGPAMNHSYHEMIIGHGGCFSTVLFTDRQESLPAAGYTAAYHTAQFLATQMALAERQRDVCAIVLKDLEPTSLAALDDFFHQAAALLK
jgi:glucose-6-phosphate isomerase